MGQTNVKREEFEQVASNWIDVLMEKQPKYGDSWRRRKHSAGDNLSRKWDRIEEALEANDWDLFKAIQNNPGDEGLIDDIRDLGNYCLLTHQHAVALGLIKLPIPYVVGPVNANMAALMTGRLNVVDKRPEAGEAQVVGAEDDSNRLCDHCGHVARSHGAHGGDCFFETAPGEYCECSGFHRIVKLEAKGPLTVPVLQVKHG